MLFQQTPASRRMMHALCCCDNRQINNAVRQYTRRLDDADLFSLLETSRSSLDQYHRAALESLLHPAGSKRSNDRAEIRNLFESFIAANPRVLEQLPANMIDGILRHAAANEPELRRQFAPSPLQRYRTVISGMAGALAALVILTIYGLLSTEDTVIPGPVAGQSVGPATSGHRANAIKIAGRHARAIRNVSFPVQRLTSTRRRHIALTILVDNFPPRQVARRTSKAVKIARSNPKIVATVSSVAPRPATGSATNVRTMKSDNSPSMVAVEATGVTQTVNSDDVEQGATGTDSSPARYCYARGSWRPC